MDKPAADPGEDVGVLTAGVIRIANEARRLPADLAVIVAAVCLTNLVALAPVVRATSLSVPFGLMFLLFVPGYAFIAALFPGTGDSATGSESVDEATGEIRLPLTKVPSSGIDGIERLALSFGLSIALSSLVGLGLNFTPWGIRFVPVLVSLSILSLVSVAIATRRRWALPATQRFRVTDDELLVHIRTALLQPMSRGELFVNVLLVLGILVAMTSVGWALIAPQPGESFTEFYLLTESEDGELIAENYRTEYSVGERQELIVGISSQEHRQVEYYVLVRWQNITRSNNSTSVLRSEQLHTFQTNLSHDETWHRRHTVTPAFPGTRLRLQYLLYRDEVPPDPRAESAYRELHLWVNATSSD